MVSLFTFFFSLILAALAAFFLGKYFEGKNGKDWKLKYTDLQKEHDTVAKEAKRNGKQLKKMTQQHEASQEKLRNMEAKYKPMVQDLKEQLAAANQSIEDKSGEYVQMKVDYKRLNENLDRKQKELDKLKEKYTTDLADSKGWKSKRASLETEIRDLKNQLERSQSEYTKARKRIEVQMKELQEVAAYKKEFRSLKSSNKKLKEDLEYWEKKHYDAHHQLTATLEKVEGLEAKLNNEIQLKQGLEIQYQNSLEKIQEFKTKFVNVNNKYNKMLAK